MDQLLDSEEGKAELRRLVAAHAGKGAAAAGAAAAQPAGLFTDVESKLAGAGACRITGLRLAPAARAV